jgi:putative DNA primase/helicase
MNTVVSRLLMTTGEDRLPVKRKYRGCQDGKLSIRLMISSNELQKLSDASTAIIGRILPLRMTESFLGREDIGLANRLMGELPGILNWGLEGLDWLVKNGKFTVDPGAAEIIEQMTALASPMHTYVREKCDTGQGDLFEVLTTALYYDHSLWRKANGHKPIASNTFGASLRAAFPHITHKRGHRQPDGTQPWVYRGIRLKKPRTVTSGGNIVLPYRPRPSEDEPEKSE